MLWITRWYRKDQRCNRSAQSSAHFPWNHDDDNNVFAFDYRDGDGDGDDGDVDDGDDDDGEDDLLMAPSLHADALVNIPPVLVSEN